MKQIALEPQQKILAQLKRDLQVNNCPSHIPALKRKCLEIENEIELLQNKEITFLSIIFSWLLEIVKTFKQSFGFISLTLFLMSLVLIKKLIY